MAGASARGWDDVLKNPDEVAKLVVDKYGEGLDLVNQTLELKRETPLISIDFTKQRGLFQMERRGVWQTGHDLLLNKTKQLEKPVNVDDVMSLDIVNRIGQSGLRPRRTSSPAVEFKDCSVTFRSELVRSRH